MSPRFRHLSFSLCAAAFLLDGAVQAQQTATTTAPSAASAAPANPATATLTSPTDAAKQMITSAIEKMNANDADGALNDLTQALRVNPNSTGAYVLRAAIYYQKKQWTQSENDFKSAHKLAPTNVVVNFNLAELKFVQKEYDAARAGFFALGGDSERGDFASYKVFLCDLFGGHLDTAKKELDALSDAMNGPSCEFSNAAWNLYHKNLEGPDGARYWLLRASRIYPPQKNNFYAQSLRDLGYLPIPSPDDNVTPPGAGNPAHP